jgi:hypothetical protein
MTPDQVPGLLEAISARVNDAAGPAVLGMANAYQARVSGVTLRTFFNAVDMPSPSPPGSPPAWVSGTLARSVHVFDEQLGGPIASAKVAPDTIYARIQELGGTIFPHRFRFLRFPYAGYIHYRKSVTLPSRPYMRPTTEEMVADGSLTAIAAAVFESSVWG